MNFILLNCIMLSNKALLQMSINSLAAEGKRYYWTIWILMCLYVIYSMCYGLNCVTTPHPN